MNNTQSTARTRDESDTEALQDAARRLRSHSDESDLRYAQIPLFDGNPLCSQGDAQDAARAIARSHDTTLLTTHICDLKPGTTVMHVFFGHSNEENRLKALGSIAEEVFDELGRLPEGILPPLPPLPSEFHWLGYAHGLAMMPGTQIGVIRKVWLVWRDQNFDSQNRCLPDTQKAIDTALEWFGRTGDTIREVRFSELETNVWRASARAISLLLALIEDWSPPNGTSRLTVNVKENKTEVDGEEFELQPHETQMLNALVEAADDGTWWMTGPELRELPACKGKKIAREFKILEERVPVLRDFIDHGGNKGYRLKR